MTQVLLTLDTALDWTSHARGLSWQRNLAAAGLPGLLETLRRHGFVDPMPALVYGIEPIRHMIEPIHSLPTAHFADLEPLPAATVGDLLPTLAWRSARHRAEPAWPNALLYRRAS